MNLHNSSRQLLQQWQGSRPYHSALRHAFVSLLDASDDAVWRHYTPGHLTASVVIVSHDTRRVLLTLHGIVGAWLQMGGHLEPGDRTLVDAARREGVEESGIHDLLVFPTPIDLDVHAITCRGYKHQTRHFDVRFAAQAPAHAEPVCSSESVDVRWFDMDDLPDMFDDTRQLIGLAVDHVRSQRAAAR